MKENQTTAGERARRGAIAGMVGIGCNILLFGAKLAVGTIANSIAITADAFNNLSDAGSSLVTLVGFRMSGKPADREHPFGHGRIEYISGLIVSFVILLVGFELLTSSVDKIRSPQEIVGSFPVILVLVLSILGKLGLGLYYRRVGKAIHSATLMAAMTDSISDTAATAAVAVSVAVSMIFHIRIDGVVGALVAIMIFIAGIRAAIDTLNPLLGQAPDPELVNALRDTVLESEGVLGIHDMLVHNYGPEQYLASLHAEVSAEDDILESHDRIDRIEREIYEKLGVRTVIHMDPVQTNSPTVNKLREWTAQALNQIDARLTFHDFRIVEGPSHTNVIFDVVVPHGFRMHTAELKAEIEHRLQEKQADLYAVITVDASFTGEL